VNSRERYLALKRVVDYYPEIFGMVFCRTKAETQEVADALIKDGYSADALHGDLSQSQRDFVMKRFRNKALQMLVATDVAARGIDVSDITHVINYNLPEDAENYTHRSGRTARAGKSGIAIAIITSKEIGKIKDLERITQKKFTKAPIPNGVDVCEKQLFNLVKKLHEVEVKDEEIEKFLPKIYEELKDLSKEELIKRFISEEFNRFYTYYQNAPDLNVSGGDGNRDGNGRSTRFFINMGMLDGFNRQSLKDFLADLTKIHPRMIFNVDVKNSFSFFETEVKFTDTFIAINKQDTEFNNRKVSLEISNRKMGSGGGTGERKSYGNSEGYSGHKSYGRSDGGNKSHGKSDVKKSFGRPFKNSGGRDEKKPFHRGKGPKRSFSRDE
jgi:ATP-dependent RNA helicase DeaD